MSGSDEVTQPDMDRLNEAILRVTELTDRGEPLDTEKLLREYTDVANELTQFMEDHERLRRIAGTGNVSSQDSTSNCTLNSSNLKGDAGNDRVRYFGDFELIEKIAHGGMGIVYRARQVTLNRLVALKMILSGELATAEDRQRFQIEAEAAAKLDHPGIVPIFEVGEHDERPYLAMGLVDGVSLSAELQEGPLAPGEAAELVKQVAEAVQYAHQHGVIHRDLKPGNVLIEQQRTPRVTDFGLAKKLQETSGVTVTGQILGTPSYMPPEQALGQNDLVRETADVYSLGAVLYAALTGRPPFQADNPLDTMRQVLEREPVSPRDLNPAIPSDLETICLKCLQKDRRERYQSAQELADDLDRFLQDRPVQARPAGRMRRVWRWCRRNAVVSSLSLLVAMSLVLGTGVSMYYSIEAEKRAEGERSQRQTADENAESARRARDEATVNAEAARIAKEKATENLRASYLSLASAHRWSKRPESRFDGLEAIRKAAAIRNDSDLINPAITLLIKPGMRVTQELPTTQAAVAFDPQLMRLARGEKRGRISIRRMRDDKELLVIPSFGKSLSWILKFSPDGQLLAVGYENQEIRLWNTETGKEVFRITGGYSGHSLDFHPDKPFVAVGRRDGTLALFDVEKRRELYRVPIGPTPYCLEFSRDGQKIATGNIRDGNVRIVNSGDGALLAKLSVGDATRCISWSVNDEFLATAGGSNAGIKIWAGNADPPRLLRILEGGHTHVVSRVQFARRSRLLASRGWDSRLCLWSPKKLQPLVRASAGYMSAPLVFGPNDRLLAGSRSNQRIQLWEIGDNTGFQHIGKIPTPDVDSNGVLSPDERWFCHYSSAGATLFALPSGRRIASLPVFFWGMQIHPNGKLLFTGSIFGLHSWPISYENEGRSIRVGPPHAIDPRGANRMRVKLDAAGKVLAYANRDRVRVCRISEEGRVKRWLFDGRHPYAAYVSVHPSGRYVASGTWHNEAGNRNVRIWETATGKLIHEHHCQGNAWLEFSSDGRWLRIVNRGRMQILEVESWKQGPTIASARFRQTDDDTILAFNRSTPAVELRTTDLKQSIVLLDSSFAQTVLRFNGDGSQLFVGAAGGELRCWNLRRLSSRLTELGLKSPFRPFPPKAKTSELPLQSAVVDYGTLGPRFDRYRRGRQVAEHQLALKKSMSRRDWEKAVDHLLVLQSLRRDERDRAASVTLAAFRGNVKSYENHAKLYQSAVSSRRKPENMAQRRIKHALLLPGLIQPKDADVKVLIAHSSMDRAFFLSTRGLFDIRQGKFDEARKRLLQASQSQQLEQYPRLKNEIACLLAICEARLDNLKEAVRLLDEAARELQAALKDISETTNQIESQIGWLHAEIFRREAETLIHGPRIKLGHTIDGRTHARIVAFPPNVVARYTLDGTVPNADSTMYRSPFTVHMGQTIRAQAFYKDGSKSAARSVQVSPGRRD